MKFSYISIVSIPFVAVSSLLIAGGIFALKRLPEPSLTSVEQRQNTRSTIAAHASNPSVLGTQTQIIPSNTFITNGVNSLSSFNLLTNSSFEAGDINSAPKSWDYLSGGNSGNIQVTNESIRTGALALKIQDSSNQTASLGIQQSSTSTVNGRNYFLTVYVRGLQVIGTPVLRLGFIGGNQPGQSYGKADSYQDFPLTPALLRDWSGVSFSYAQAGLGKHPFIQILNYGGGKIFLDDASLYEYSDTPGRNSLSSLYQSLTKIGDGSIVTDTLGNLYPANGYSGSLGIDAHRWDFLDARKADFSSDVHVAGNQTVDGNLKVTGAATVSGLMNVTGNLNFPNLGTGIAHFSSTGGVSSSAVDLSSSDVTETLGVTKGGTGATTLTQNGVLYGNGINGIVALTPGSSGYILQSNGVSGAPSWVNLGSIGGTNALSLLGFTWAAPGTIGSTTPNTGAFSTLLTTSDIHSVGNQITDGNLRVGGGATISGVLNLSGVANLTNYGAGIAHFSSGGVISSSAIDLASSDVTNSLGVARGGTGATTLTQNGVLYGNGTGALSALTPGTSGYVLQSNGVSGAPIWISTASFGSTNALTLLGSTWAAPGTIGNTTASSAAFTTLSTSSDLTDNANLYVRGPKPWADVQAYGAKGDGTTDDTTAIQAALDAVNTAGGGEVHFPAGTYITTTLTIYSKVHLRGAGIEASILKLKNNANVDLVKSFNFDSLTGTNSTGGIYNWSISNLTLDGNKANNTTSFALRVYGYGFILDNLRVRNAVNDGIYSEWSSSSNTPGVDSMEAHISGLKVHDNGGNGITWAGPHDSSFVNMQVYINADKGVWFKSAATGAQVTNGHAWGNTNYGWYIEGGSVSLSNTEGEGSNIAQLFIGAGGDTVTGGIFFAGGASLASATGIKIGDATHLATGFNITTEVTDFNTGVGIAFTNDGGGGSVKANVYQTGSTGVTGTPSTSTTVNIHVNGGGTGPITNIASGNVGIGNNAPGTKLDVNGTIRAYGAGNNHIGSYLIPQGGSGNGYRMGYGNNIYYDGSNWVTSGDGSNNGGSLILSGYSANSSNFVFYTIPGNGGTGQTIANSSLSTYERMRLSSAGYLGIGNTSPNTLLDMQGAVTGRALVNINETGDQNLFTASASSTTRFSIDRSGNIISANGAKWQPLSDSTTSLNIANAAGTNYVSFDSVGSRFVVNGASGQLLKLNTISNLATDSATILYNSRVSIGYDGTLQGILINDNGNVKPTAFQNGGSERMRIAANGAVGIGTAAPLAQLQVNGNFTGNAAVILNDLNSTDILAASRSGTPVFRLANNGDLVLANAAQLRPLTDSATAINIANAAGTNFVNFDSTSSRILLTSSGGQVLRLATTGNTSSDTATILFNNRALVGFDGTTQGLLLSDSGTTKPTVFQNGGAERVRIAADGAVGIGTNAPSAQFQVNGNYTGNAAVIFNDLNSTDILAASSSGTPVYRLANNGDLVLASGVQLRPLADSGTAINIANAAGTNFINFDSASNREIITGSGQELRLATTANTSSDTATILFNNRAVMGYDGTVQGLLFSDNAVNKPTVFQNGGSERMRITSAGGIGIGTANPLSAFQVNSNFAVNAAAIFNQQNVGDILAASVSGVTKFKIDNTGNVTIAALNTAGGIVYTDGTGLLNTSAQGSSSQCLLSNGASAPSWGTCGSSGSVFQIISGAIVPLNATADFIVGGQATASAKFAVLNVNSGAPTATLSAGIAGGAYLTSTGKLATTALQSLTLGDSSTGNIILSQGGSIGIGTINPTAKIEISGTGGNYMKFTTTTALSTDTIYQMFNNRATFGYDGTVQGVLITDNNTAKPIVFQTSNVERFRVTAAGLVSIGATTPLATFDVRGNNGTLPVASVSGQTSNTALLVDQSGLGDIFTASKSGATKFVVTNAGNVGVNDSNPSNTLKVFGSLCVKSTAGGCAGAVSGTIYASNTVVQTADLAENYISATALEPGDVVVPAADGNNAAMIKSTTPAQSSVIGVISTKPGVTMNSDAATDPAHPYIYPVGLSGRVPVKVSSENGIIQVGDYLTTSSRPGIAMKATQTGAVIGKALEPYADLNPSHVDKILTFVGISWYSYNPKAPQDSVVIPATPSAFLQTSPTKNTISVNLTLQALKNLEVSGELVVYKKAEFQGPAFFRKIVEFFDTVIFHNKVEFQSEATFTADTAGYAIIPAGNKKVDVTFTKPLSVTPVVTVTLKTLTKLDAYRVTNESNKGFTIEMVPTQSQDIEFSWTALSVSEIHTTKNEATPTPTPASPQPTPSASVSPGISTLPSASPSPTPATQSATIVISPSPVPSPSPTPTPPSPTASASSTLKQ